MKKLIVAILALLFIAVNISSITPNKEITTMEENTNTIPSYDDWNWYKYEGNPIWGSTNISDTFLATDWIHLSNIGNITWGANYDIQAFFNATSGMLEWIGKVNNLSIENLQATASYIIWTDGNGNYYAMNGTTELIEFSGTNASWVIQSCVDALPTSGGEIFFKVGKYNIDKTIDLSGKRGIKIIGESCVRPGSNTFEGIGVELKTTRNIGILTKTENAGTPEADRTYVWVEGISFIGTETGTTSTSLLYFSTNENVYVKDCILTHNLGNGLYLSACERVILWNVEAGYNTNNGVILSGGQFLMIDGMFYNNGGDGIYLKSTGTIYNTYAFGNKHGFEVDAGSGRIVFYNARATSNNWNGFYIKANRTELYSCYALNNDQGGHGSSGCYIDASYVKIIGGSFVDDQTPKTQNYGIYFTSSATNNIVEFTNLEGNQVGAVGGTIDKSNIIRNNIGYISPHDTRMEASYVIFTDGTNVYAMNGSTGRIESQDTNASWVIQQAIDTAYSNGGGKIFIKAGTYEINYEIKLKDNIFIQGEKQTILKMMNKSINCLHVWYKNNVTISGIQIDGNRENIGNQTGDSIGNGIRVEGSENIVISNVFSFNCPAHGIFLYNAGNNIIVDKCILKNNWFRGIHSHGGGKHIIVSNIIATENKYGGIFLCYDADTDVTLTNSISYNNCDEALDRGALEICGAEGAGHRLVISNCIFKDNVSQYVAKIVVSAYEAMIDNCIFVGGTNTINVIYFEGNCNNISIQNCLIDGTGASGHAINIKSSENIKIDNCIVKCGSNGYCIFLNTDTSRCTITNNHLYGDNYGGIGLWDNNQNNIITNNIITSGIRWCIKAYNTNVDCENNIIKNNQLFGTLTPRISDFTNNNIICDNIGYTTEASGSYEITGDGTNTSWSISHGLATTPSQVLITPTNSSMASATYWVSAKDATTFTITFSSAPASGTKLSFDWYAKV